MTNRTLTELSSFRVELGEAGDIEEQEAFTRRDAAMIQDVRNTLKMSAQNKGTASGDAEAGAASFLSTTTQVDLSQLVAVRRAHQTKRAANSVKTRASPHDAVSTRSPEPTDRQRLCAQMAEVIRRAGSGLERDARWKSGTAPGTRSPAEVLALTGNSANAEVVAKERVNTVCHLFDRMKDLPPHVNSCRPGRHVLNSSTGLV